MHPGLAPGSNSPEPPNLPLFPRLQGSVEPTFPHLPGCKIFCPSYSRGVRCELCTTAPHCAPHAAGAGVQLVKKAGAEVVEAACVIELPELHGRQKLTPLGLDLFVLVEKEGI